MRAVIYVGSLRIAKTKYGQFPRGKCADLPDAVVREILKIPGFEEPTIYVSRKKTTENASQRTGAEKQDRRSRRNRKAKSEPPKIALPRDKTGKICNSCIDLKKQKKVHFYICLNPKSELFKVPLPHGKTRKACRLWKTRTRSLYPLIPQTVPEGMRFIENLRNKYGGSEFWIIGSDPNLDFYPDDFFRDKLSIAVGISCIAFPESTFFMSAQSFDPEEMKSMRCDRKSILPLEFLVPVPRSFAIGRWENWGLDPIYMKLEAKRYSSASPDYEPMAKQIFSDEPCEFALARTTAHLAIYAAAILGAKKIILVGCSHEISGGAVYAQKRGIGAANKPGPIRIRASSQTYGRMRRDTKELTRTFKKYDVEVVRHRFDKDKDEFVFEEIEETSYETVQ